MTSLEAIGTPHQVSSPRRESATVPRVPEPAPEKPVEQEERVARRPQAQRVEAATNSFQARLNYDRDADEVIVEILNPQTGDVLRRLPAEDLPEDVRALVSDSGPLVRTVA